MKPAIRSKTILGIVIAVLPQLAALAGIEVSGDEVTTLLNAAVTLAGAAYAIYGRLTAYEAIRGIVR